MSRYTLGIDYGSLSGRVVLVDVANGNEVESIVVPYKHGVMRQTLLNTDIVLPRDWALQHPRDYLDVLELGIKSIMKASRVKKENIIGIGVDFTACTVLPIDSEGDPLCFKDKYKNRPHAYVKLWQHHAAQIDADLINRVAMESNESFIYRYGKKVSSEWLLPKAMQILREDPVLYTDMYRFIEAGDWIVLQLTGEEKRNSCAAGYKGLWSKKDGYPSSAFLSKLDNRLDGFYDNKVSKKVYSVGDLAGYLTGDMAELLGLQEGTPVGVANIDAHVAVPSAGIYKPGEMLLIMGTSTCHMIMDDNEYIVEGISGVVEDGILPTYYGYEAGQACVGDMLNWFISNCLSKEYKDKADSINMSVHDVLEEQASKLEIGESGLLALDWFNGNRSTLDDSNLTGMILGLKMNTMPHEIYRALIESTAFGTKMIIDNFEKHGVEINKLYATGGIAKKNKLMMQIYSDVCNREIQIVVSDQACALGSAMFGAVAAGRDNGGYDTIFEAAKAMAKPPVTIYRPNLDRHKKYMKIYKEYQTLYNYFGIENGVMKRLSKIYKSI